MMYEKMKKRVEEAVESRKISEHISEKEREAFGKWSQGFTCEEHPSVIEAGFMLFFSKLFFPSLASTIYQLQTTIIKRARF